MKKNLLVLSTIVFCACALVTIPAFSVNQERGTISVNTTSYREVTPDTAEISFAVITTDNKSMQTATKNNKEITDKVYAVLNKLINKENGDYIKTSDFNCAPKYSYNNSKRVFENYEVSNRIIVHTKSIDVVGKMIDSSINSGATNVDSLNFSLSNSDAQCDELIVNTTKKAYNRATAIAKTLNHTLDGIQSFSSSCNSNNSQTPKFYMAKNMLAATADAVESSGVGAPISGGVIKLNANVNVNFYVK